jgi:uncharacterized protein YjiS (DUF1127 family)
MNTTALARQRPFEPLLLERLRAALQAWQRRRLERATLLSLAELDNRLLHDIGLDRSEIPSVAHALGGDDTRRRLLVV